MINIEYKCDRCHKDVKDPEQFWVIGVGFGHYQKRPIIQNEQLLQICRPCLESFGLVPPRENRPAPSTETTTENLILEILGRCGIEPME